MGRPKLDYKMRFAKYTKRMPNGCLEWTGSKTNKGYGKVSVYEQGIKLTIPAHRFAWMIFVGEIPENLLLCHHCDNRLCCDVEHLFLGTQKDNIQDMIKKGRGWHIRDGENHINARLTNEQVREIRRRAGRRNRSALAREFGIGRTTVGRILANEVYKPERIGDIFS